MKPQDDKAGTNQNSQSGPLDEVETTHVRLRVYRIAVIPNEDGFIEGLELPPRQELNLKENLPIADQQKDLKELLDAPFRLKRKELRRKTRFSDGSYTVFYSALELETAECECAYWFREAFLGSPEGDRVAYFERFSCWFTGEEKDLRVKKSVWPKLVDDDYEFCNAIGRQAHKIGLDGLLAPSARRENGSTAPVFSRASIGRAQPEGSIKMTILPESQSVTIEEL